MGYNSVIRRNVCLLFMYVPTIFLFLYFSSFSKTLSIPARAPIYFALSALAGSPQDSFRGVGFRAREKEQKSEM